MAKSGCEHCGARFEGEGAAEALSGHIVEFHPPVPASTEVRLVSRAKVGPAGGPAVDTEAREAIRALGELVQGFGERLTALEESVVEPVEAGAEDMELAEVTPTTKPKAKATETIAETTSPEA